jgi:hypothetical protein
MHIRINNRNSFLSGLFYIGVGAVAAVLSTQYEIGTALQMGPGFFPFAIAIILIALGAGVVVQSMLLGSSETTQTHNVAPLLMVFVGMLSFALLIERAGLVVAIGALLFFSCFRRLREKPLEVLATYVALATAASVLFVYLFGLPIAIFPW